MKPPYQESALHIRGFQIEDCLNPMRRKFGDRKISQRSEILQVPKLSLHGIYIPNGCKQLFYENKANSNTTLRKSTQGSIG